MKYLLLFGLMYLAYRVLFPPRRANTQIHQEPGQPPEHLDDFVDYEEILDEEK